MFNGSTSFHLSCPSYLIQYPFNSLSPVQVCSGLSKKVKPKQSPVLLPGVVVGLTNQVLVDSFIRWAGGQVDSG